MSIYKPNPPVPADFTPYDRSSNPFQERLGTLFVRRDGGSMELALLAEPHHSNGRSVHGGVLLSLADQVLSLTLRETYGSSATVTLNCDLASSVAVGEWIFGSAELVRETRSLLFVRGRLWAGDRTVLTASGIWKRLRSTTEA